MKLTKKKIIFSALAVSLLVGGSVFAYIGTHQKVQKNSDTPVILSVEKTEEKAVEVTPTAETSAPVAESVEPTATPVSPPANQTEDSNPYGKDTMLGYAYERRESAGRVVGGWGMGNQWPTLARQAGAVVDRTPEIGSTYTEGSNVYTVESFTESDLTITIYMGAPQTSTISRERASAGWFIH